MINTAFKKFNTDFKWCIYVYLPYFPNDLVNLLQEIRYYTVVCAQTFSIKLIRKMKYLAVLLRQSVRVNHSPADSAYKISLFMFLNANCSVTRESGLQRSLPYIHTHCSNPSFSPYGLGDQSCFFTYSPQFMVKLSFVSNPQVSYCILAHKLSAFQNATRIW